MKQKEVLQKRRKVVATLPGPEEVLRGSLLERTIFHKKGCSRCEAGEGHKVWVLTVTYPGGRDPAVQYSTGATPDGAALARQL